MQRIVILAAAAAALVALPAGAESLRVSTAGKSERAVRADIVHAARTVCRRENMGAFDQEIAERICVQAAVSDAFTQLKAQTAAAQPAKLALR